MKIGLIIIEFNDFRGIECINKVFILSILSILSISSMDKVILFIFALQIIFKKKLEFLVEVNNYLEIIIKLLCLSSSKAGLG
jgi:hypothetical protein